MRRDHQSATFVPIVRQRLSIALLIAGTAATACGPAETYNSWEPSDYSYESDDSATTSSSKVCIYYTGGRFTCPGISQTDTAQWECSSVYRTLGDCTEAFADNTSCSGDCCSRDWYSSHQIVDGPCADALSNTTSSGTTSTNSTSDAGATCTDAGGACGSLSNCCPGSQCVNYADYGLRCGDYCVSGSGCGSGCCVYLISGSAKVCAPAEFCQPSSCLPTGSSCGGSEDCCSDSLCIDYGSDNISCGLVCTTDSDCSSGCCADLDNSTAKVCAPERECNPLATSSTP